MVHRYIGRQDRGTRSEEEARKDSDSGSGSVTQRERFEAEWTGTEGTRAGSHRPLG